MADDATCFLCCQATLAQNEHHELGIDQRTVFVDPVANPLVAGEDQPAVVLDGSQPDLVRGVVPEMPVVRHVRNICGIQRSTQLDAPSATVDKKNRAVFE